MVRHLRTKRTGMGTALVSETTSASHSMRLRLGFSRKLMQNLRRGQCCVEQVAECEKVHQLFSLLRSVNSLAHFVELATLLWGAE